MKKIIHTHEAPKAIGTYSQAVQIDNTVYLSGQIPLVPETMELVKGDIKAQLTQIFYNVEAVCKAAGGGLSDIVRITIYLMDLSKFSSVNEVMAEFFKEPYPARVAIGVAALPKNAEIEVDAIMVLV